MDLLQDLVENYSKVESNLQHSIDLTTSGDDIFDLNGRGKSFGVCKLSRLGDQGGVSNDCKVGFQRPHRRINIEIGLRVS